ncbi:DUF4362 domain-containing protein [Paenibacillus tepidiphilus]|uniref:DUF4362 domain-containing protein n=1 Tax=Paenibacillus tepidiphilus TaxID=2608683 RepID=UPI0013A54BE0|nr:DUF4362 domain-containing protein [Paenibacillus tepidiphilus]
MNLKRFFIVLLFLTFFVVACSKSLKSDEAAEKGYVVFSNDGVMNYEKFELFIDKVDNDENARVKIVNYTDEGDPIFHTLEYTSEQNTISYTFDSSEDEFGERKKVNTQCKYIIENEAIFTLSDCEDELIGNHFYVKQQR